MSFCASCVCEAGEGERSELFFLAPSPYFFHQRCEFNFIALNQILWQKRNGQFVAIHGLLKKFKKRYHKLLGEFLVLDGKVRSTPQSHCSWFTENIKGKQNWKKLSLPWGGFSGLRCSYAAAGRRVRATLTSSCGSLAGS